MTTGPAPRWPQIALFSARILRMFAFGMLAVVLAQYLAGRGLSTASIGLLFAFTMAGDTVISLFLTTRADRIGRRRTLAIGAILLAGASAVFALTGSFWALVVAATVGVLSPSGNEVGPFLPVEQAALAEGRDAKDMVGTLARYSLAGYVATALGALTGGWLARALQHLGSTPLSSWQTIVFIHGSIGLLMAALYLSAPAPVESQAPKDKPLSLTGLDKSQKIVLTLATLFSLDAFAGGFVMQSLIAFWFAARWGANEGQVGTLLFAGNLAAAASSLAAPALAKKFGLVNTMVFTHLPSNVLLMLVPLAPSFEAAAVLLFLRFCLSQMDVPTRQAFVMAVVTPEERSAAGGITNVARSVGVTVSPLFTGLAFVAPAIGIPFLVGGGLKIVYDLALYAMCRKSGFK